MVISGQRVFPFIAVENPQIEAWREGRQLPLITINVGLVSQQIVQEQFWVTSSVQSPPQSLYPESSYLRSPRKLIATSQQH